MSTTLLEATVRKVDRTDEWEAIFIEAMLDFLSSKLCPSLTSQLGHLLHCNEWSKQLFLAYRNGALRHHLETHPRFIFRDPDIVDNIVHYFSVQFAAFERLKNLEAAA